MELRIRWVFVSEALYDQSWIRFRVWQRLDWVVRGIVSVLVLAFCVPGLLVGCSSLAGAQSLLPSEDIPEEVLQTQAIVSARSSWDGRAKSANDYAQEQQRLRVKPEEVPAQLAPEVHQAIFLLRLQKLMRGLLPFL